MLRINLSNNLKKNLMIQEIFNNKNFKKIMSEFWNTFVFKSTFTQKYYTRSENMWNDGFLFDFLQKKTADAWIRRFVIYTGFLFSERLVFDYVVRIYLDNLIWPLHDISIFETSNVSEMLLNVLFLYLSLFTLLLSVYLLLL
jgi:hypothetical protein